MWPVEVGYVRWRRNGHLYNREHGVGASAFSARIKGRTQSWDRGGTEHPASFAWSPRRGLAVPPAPRRRPCRTMERGARVLDYVGLTKEKIEEPFRHVRLGPLPAVGLVILPNDPEPTLQAVLEHLKSPDVYRYGPQTRQDQR